MKACGVAGLCAVFALSLVSYARADEPQSSVSLQRVGNGGSHDRDNDKGNPKDDRDDDKDGHTGTPKPCPPGVPGPQGPKGDPGVLPGRQGRPGPAGPRACGAGRTSGTHGFAGRQGRHGCNGAGGTDGTGGETDWTSGAGRLRGCDWADGTQQDLRVSQAPRETRAPPDRRGRTGPRDPQAGPEGPAGRPGISTALAFVGTEPIEIPGPVGRQHRRPDRPGRGPVRGHGQGSVRQTGRLRRHDRRVHARGRRCDRELRGPAFVNRYGHGHPAIPRGGRCRPGAGRPS